MTQPIVFYKALDPVKGSWDGYGFFHLPGESSLAYVSDAPSGASIHTPVLIQEFWSDFCKTVTHIDAFHLADGINRLQYQLIARSRADGTPYQSTLCLAFIQKERLLYCAIGDSVIQVLRQGKLFRLSESDLWDGALIMDASETYRERLKTQEIRFIGSGGRVVPESEIRRFELLDDDLLLLQSDGLEDLLPPNEMIKLMMANPAEMKTRLNTLFAPERIKDDVTLLALRVSAPKPFDAQEKIQSLHQQTVQLKKEIEHVRQDMAQSAWPLNRLEKMESGIVELQQQMQSIKKKSLPAGGAVSITRKSRMPSVSLIIIVAFLLGLVTGLGFLLFRKQDAVPVNSPPQVSTAPPQRERTVAPPEIPAQLDCTYTVQNGDSLDKIARARGTTVDALLSYNPSLHKEAPLKSGDKVTVCGEKP